MRENFPEGDKVYFLDTSAILHDPDSIEILSAGGNIVVILTHVLKELDNSKTFRDQAGINSRVASRLLEGYRQTGSLSDGIKTKNGGIILVDHDGNEEYFENRLIGLPKTVDNWIIATALYWKEKAGEKYRKIAIITKDINLRVMANVFGLKSEDYESDKHIKRITELYTGSKKITFPETERWILYELSHHGIVHMRQFSREIAGLFSDLLPNECLYLNVVGKRILAIFDKRLNALKWVKRPFESSREARGYSKAKKIMPKNDEQAFLYSLLMNKNISLVSVTGPAGTGKTLISLLAAMLQVDLSEGGLCPGEKGLYKTIMVYRPNLEIGNSLGFLPGKIDDKFAPWKVPILDNLSLILSDMIFNEMNRREKPEADRRKVLTLKSFMEKGLLTIEPINYIRGRSLHGAFVLIDEAQNLTPHEVKTISTRAGIGTKIVFTGDYTQIDNPLLDAVSCGLTHVVQGMKGEVLAATIQLRKDERSSLSEKAAKRL